MTTHTGRTGHIAWRQYGDDPAIVLLHGFTDCALCWEPIIPGLDGRGVLALDARGHGDSGLPEEEYGTTDQAADAAAVLDDLGLTSIVVMGHSMGGATAAALAESRPDLVRAAILEDPFIAHGQPARSAEVPPDFRDLQTMSIPELVAKSRAEHPNWADADHQPWAESRKKFNLDVYRLRGRSGAPTVSTVRELPMPVLLLHGDTGAGSIIPADVLAALEGSVATVHIRGAGHSLRREQPEQFLTAVNAFVNSLS